MRNLIIGMLLGVFLTTAFGVSASISKPRIIGDSGPLNYAVVIDGEVACVRPWVSIPERFVECDSGADEREIRDRPLEAE